MEYSSDDPVEDPNFMPDEDFSDTSTSDDNDSQIWNPPRISRRLSTFSDSDIHPLPEIERRRSSRTAPVDLELQPPNVPSTSGNTDAQISEQEWMEEKQSNIKWEMPSHDDPLAIDYTVPCSGMKDIYVGLANANPIDYYDLFLTPNILEYITEQTNLYATQCILPSDSSAGSRNHLWTPVTFGSSWMDGFGEITKYQRLLEKPQTLWY